MKKALHIITIILLGYTNLWATETPKDSVSGFFVANKDALYVVKNSLSVNKEIVNDYNKSEKTEILEATTSIIPETKKNFVKVETKSAKIEKEIAIIKSVKTKHQKQVFNFTALPLSNQSSYASSLGIANKLSVVPVTINTNFVCIAIEYPKFQNRNLQKRITKTSYKNPALGLSLQNDTSFFNKPPPF